MKQTTPITCGISEGPAVAPDLDGLLLPLAVLRGKKVLPMDEDVTFRRGDRRAEIEERLQRAGWVDDDVTARTRRFPSTR
jgi:hypothetical protein